ncbi:MAG: RNA polymerase sigma factor [Isosphaeraceae bacterium]
MSDKLRLTEIPTEWTLIRTSQTSLPEGAKMSEESRDATHILVGRYHDAIERFLRMKLRDQNLVDEVKQEFWTKFLSQKLAGADPSKGRFRDYLRTVLHRLIIDHFRGRKLQPLPPGDLLDPTSNDEEFDHVWRELVIKRVLCRLESYELGTPNNRYWSVLSLRLEKPDAPIEELAALLSDRDGRGTTPEAFRKTLQRARRKFLDLLIEELRETIHPAEPEDIEAEIYDLGLGPLYRRYSAEFAS